MSSIKRPGSPDLELTATQLARCERRKHQPVFRVGITELPQELERHIFHFVDEPSLWQLAHVSVSSAALAEIEYRKRLIEILSLRQLTPAYSERCILLNIGNINSLTTESSEHKIRYYSFSLAHDSMIGDSRTKIYSTLPTAASALRAIATNPILSKERKHIEMQRWIDQADLPVEFDPITSIELEGNHLNIDQRITNIPEELKHCRHLQTISLPNQRLQHLPDIFAHFSELTFLNLSSNPLVELPPSVNSLTQLTHLHLSETRITSERIEEYLNACWAQGSFKLRDLSLHSNQYKGLSATWKTRLLEHLVRIEFQFEPLEFIPLPAGETFENLTRGFMRNLEKTLPPGLNLGAFPHLQFDAFFILGGKWFMTFHPS